MRWGRLLGVPELWGSAGPGADSSPMPPGTAGVIISLSRIFTKLLLSDEKENTVIFFFISIGMELTCFILHLLVKRTRFVRYYTACSRKGLPETRGAGDHGTGYRIHHDVTAEDIRFVSRGRVSSMAPGVPLPTRAQRWCPLCSMQENPSRGQPSSPRGSPGAEAELAGSGTYMRFDVPRPKIKRSWPSFRGGWLAQGGGGQTTPTGWFCSILQGRMRGWWPRALGKDHPFLNKPKNMRQSHLWKPLLGCREDFQALQG